MGLLKELIVDTFVVLALAVMFAGALHRESKCHERSENTNTVATP